MYGSSTALEFFIILMSCKNPIIVLLDQVKQFILVSGCVLYEGSKESSSSLFNLMHRGEYILSPDPSAFSDHLVTTIVDVPPFGAWLIFIATSGSKSSFRIDYLFYSLEKKP